jgi:DNA (cytosine-5)-methyltransferase 1
MPGRGGEDDFNLVGYLPEIALSRDSHAGRQDGTVETFIVNAAESCAKKDHARESDVARCLDGTGSFASAQGGTIVVGSLQAHSKRHGHAMGTQQAAESGQLVFTELGEGHVTYQQSETVNGVRTPQGGGSQMANLVSHSLRGTGFDASEDGTGRGTPIVPTFAIQERAVSENPENGPQGKGYQEGLAFSLEARHHQQSVANRQGVRRLTPLECLRLQGFPDSWLDGLGLSDSAKYQMIGNAFPPPMAEWVGKRISG